jgi:DNA-binding NtrC family response regulator
MQAAYRRLAGLAATDLPVWLIGERGTELEELARLVHQLRGLPEGSFHVWDHADGERVRIVRRASKRKHERSDFAEGTVFAPFADAAPPGFQSLLYDHLLKDLYGSGSCRIVVSSGPVDLVTDNLSDISTELFAFLAPTSVRIVPLRNRIEDIPGLVSFAARHLGFHDPAPRITPEALDLLRQYHWPGNTQELKWVTAYMVKKRPSGDIRPLDLPETIRPPAHGQEHLLEELQEIGEKNGFRVLASQEGRGKLSAFLTERGNARFTASDIQRLFSMGRETARRLLQALEAAGLVIGTKGAAGCRVTGYRCSGK